MTNPPFNAKSFDLGRLDNIVFSSDSTISEKILGLNKDETGKYYLTPQNQLLPEIQYQNEIAIGDSKSYFYKSTFIGTSTAKNTHEIIKTYIIPLNTNASKKRKYYISVNLDLYGISSSLEANTDNLQNVETFVIEQNISSGSGLYSGLNSKKLKYIFVLKIDKDLDTSIISVTKNKPIVYGNIYVVDRDSNEVYYQSEINLNSITSAFSSYTLTPSTTVSRKYTFQFNLKDTTNNWNLYDSNNNKYIKPSYFSFTVVAARTTTAYKTLKESLLLDIDKKLSLSLYIPGSPVAGMPFSALIPVLGQEIINQIPGNTLDNYYNFTTGYNIVGSKRKNITLSTEKKYSCVDAYCVEDIYGAFSTLDECTRSCTQYINYACTGNPDYKCIPSNTGFFTSEDECLNSCSSSSFLYSCSGSPLYQCEQTPDGTLTFEQCKATCSSIPSTKYSCSGPQNYSCYEDSNGVYTSLAECQQIGCKSPLRYSCNGNGTCYINTTGPFTTIEDCQATCIPPLPTRWNCSPFPTDASPDRKKCIQDNSGEFETQEQCMDICEPELPIHDTSEIGRKNTHPIWSKNLDSDVENLEYNFTHIPGSFSILINDSDTPVMFGSENKHQYYEDVITYKQQKITKTNEYANNILVLQPNYSTLENPIQNGKVNIKDYPIIRSSINSNGDLVLTIEAKSLQYSNYPPEWVSTHDGEKINWFGKVELFVSTT